MILDILKVIGTIIVVLLLVFLLLGLATLFVPVGYKINAKKDGSKVSARGIMSMFFNFLIVEVLYNEELYVNIRVAGIKVKQLFPENVKKPKSTSIFKKKSREETSSSDKSNIDSSLKEPSDKVDTILDEPNNQEHQEQVNSATTDKTADKTTDNETNATPDSKRPKKRTIVQKIQRKIRELKRSFMRWRKSFQSKKELVAYYLDLLGQEDTKYCLNKIKKIIFKMLKHVKPKKLQMNLRIGFEDNPYLMGQVCSVYGILYPIYSSHVKLITYYDQEILDGDLFIKGRMQMIVFLYLTFIAIIDKKIRQLFRKVIREVL